MELRQLRYFVRMVELGNMTRAARELFIAQPALSQQLKRLEESVGTRLIERSVRGISATPAGELFYKHAKSILRQVENTRLAMRAEERAPSGAVSVAMPASTARLVAVPLLRQIIDRYPAVQLRLLEQPSASLPSAVQRGESDIAIVVDRLSTPGLRLDPLLCEDLFAVLPASKHKTMKSVTLKALADMPLILPDRGNSIRIKLDLLFAQHRLEPRMVAEINVTSLLALAVLGELAATVLPWSAIAEHEGAGRMLALPLTRPTTRRELALCILDDGNESPAVDAVSRVIREVCAGLIKEGRWRGARLRRSANHKIA